MKVELQGDGECMLATIAALSNRPLAEVRKVACRAAGIEKWREVITPCWTPYWAAVTFVAEYFGGKTLLNLVGDWKGVSPPGSVRCLPKSISKLPKHGKGAVVMDMGQEEDTTHIMPWENGRIYDPETPKSSYTIRQWLQRYPYAKVARITFMDEV